MKKLIKFDEILLEMSEKLTGIKYPDFKNMEFLDWNKLKIILIENKIINENDYNIEDNLYQTKYFIEFFEKIKNIKLAAIISANTIQNIFKTIFNRIHKFNKTKDIFILKFSFNKFTDFKKAIQKANMYNSKIDINYYIQVYQQIIFPNYSNIGGLYVPSKEENLAIMFINELSYNENTIKHELIHYFQDILGISLIDNIDLNKDIFNNYGLCENIKLELLFREQEYVPYANEICYVFELFGIKSSEQSFEIINKFKDYLLLNEEMINKYINKCKNLTEYNWFTSIKKQNIIEFFMLCNIYAHEQCNKMIQIIEEYFK